jgi:hypothetical protein
VLNRLRFDGGYPTEEEYDERARQDFKSIGKNTLDAIRNYTANHGGNVDNMREQEMKEEVSNYIKVKMVVLGGRIGTYAIPVLEGTTTTTAATVMNVGGIPDPGNYNISINDVAPVDMNSKVTHGCTIVVSKKTVDACTVKEEATTEEEPKYPQQVVISIAIPTRYAGAMKYIVTGGKKKCIKDALDELEIPYGNVWKIEKNGATASLVTPIENECVITLQEKVGLVAMETVPTVVDCMAGVHEYYIVYIGIFPGSILPYTLNCDKGDSIPVREVLDQVGIPVPGDNWEIVVDNAMATIDSMVSNGSTIAMKQRMDSFLEIEVSHGTVHRCPRCGLQFGKIDAPKPSGKRTPSRRVGDVV